MTATPDIDTSLRWRNEGERTLSAAIDRLTDDAFGAASLLPGWSRATLLAHLALNADALVNLLAWARTGLETPMYSSPGARDSDIATSSAQPAAELRAGSAAASARLDEAIRLMPAAAWTAAVRTAQGRTVPATEVLWLRAREVWVHTVDLDAGVRFEDLPLDFSAALVDDVLAVFLRRDQSPDGTLVATDIDRSWGSGAVAVRGPVTELAAWLTRSDTSGLTGDAPQLMAWL